MTVAQIRKALVAVGAASGVAVAALADGSLTSSEAVSIVLALLGALGVYQVPNAPLRKRDAQGRFTSAGVTVLEAAAISFIVVLLLLVIL